MTFKKDYINYVLYTVVINSAGGLPADYRLKKLVDKITAVDDVVKITYMLGKTAGLEFLFKYILYISDKIDKSHVTIFNLKDNFDYDIKNLTKICKAIQSYKTASSKKIQFIQEDNTDEKNEIGNKDNKKNKIEKEIKEPIKIDLTEEESSNLINMEDAETFSEEISEEISNESGESNLTLIENPDSYSGEAEVFELSNIDNPHDEEITEEETDEVIEDTKDTKGEGIVDTNDELTSEDKEDVFGLDELEEEMHDTEGINIQEIESEDDIIDSNEDENEKPANIKVDSIEELAEIEILINKQGMEGEYSETHVKEESVTNEAYYKFETKFFEEVKILEKLFSTVGNDCVSGKDGKLNEKCLQSLTEIIEITSELSSLSRQLSFDLIADIFLTMNLFFTKGISAPGILTDERVNLLDSALALVNSLIKGEDYLNYDAIVDRIENLKNEVMRPAEEHFEVKAETIPEQNFESERSATEELFETVQETENYHEIIEPVKTSNTDSANFKMKYLVKEFEKTFLAISKLSGEYSKFDALEKIDDLNNAMRLIAKISSSVKMQDILKLAEVSYVFLKYVKDYRMDVLDAEIQQIIKYIIFTFKMLLTNRKPEDFNVLVQHLNNPVKIFTDS